MKKLLSFALAAITFGVAPCFAQTADTFATEAFKAMEHGNLNAALRNFEKVNQVAPGDFTMGWVAATRFFISQGGKFTYNGNTYNFTPASRNRNPEEMLATCSPLRKGASAGNLLAKAVLDYNWRDCKNYGDHLYVANDGVIRISGTAPRGSGMSGGFSGAMAR
jgi:hypothetical protein